MLDLTVSNAELAELKPLVQALEKEESTPDEHILDEPLSAMATEVAGFDVTVKMTTNSSHSLTGFELIMVGLFDHGDERDLGSAEMWFAALYGAFWHELAHVLYSDDVPELDDARDRYALNMLEDARIERRLVNTRPEARSWLRRNALLGRDAEHLSARAATEGWAHEQLIVGARLAAGVIDPSENDDFLTLVPEAEQLTDVTALFVDYVHLNDDGLDAAVVGPLAQAVRPHLREHHRIDSL